MFNEEITNFINIYFEKIDISQIPTSYLSIYKTNENDENYKMNCIFSSLHYRINQKFKELNDYITKQKSYYHAENGRNLLSTIAEINGVINKFKEAKVSIKFNFEYEQLFLKCQDFIKPSGSTIPDDFNQINIIYGAIFVLPLKQNSIFQEPISKMKKVLIGEGSFAIVHKYKDLQYDCMFAEKTLKKASTQQEIERFKREFSLMKNHPYPYIVTVYKFDETKLSYTMEYCEYNLEKYLIKYNTQLKFNQRKNLALQFLKAIGYLHNKQILHRDLSYGNILIKEYSDIPFLKLSDFGLSKDLYTDYTKTDSSIKGTFIDPCLANFKDYDIQNEMYSIGLIIWYIFTGRKNIFLDEDNETIYKIVSKCINTPKSHRYSNVLELYSEIKGLTSLNEQIKTNNNLKDINEIKLSIVEELYKFSANELPFICNALGLKEGTITEANSGKRAYVHKRIVGFNIDECLLIIEKLKEQHNKQINIYK